MIHPPIPQRKVIDSALNAIHPSNRKICTVRSAAGKFALLMKLGGERMFCRYCGYKQPDGCREYSSCGQPCSQETAPPLSQAQQCSQVCDEKRIAGSITFTICRYLFIISVIALLVFWYNMLPGSVDQQSTYAFYGTVVALVFSLVIYLWAIYTQSIKACLMMLTFSVMVWVSGVSLIKTYNDKLEAAVLDIPKNGSVYVSLTKSAEFLTNDHESIESPEEYVKFNFYSKSLVISLSANGKGVMDSPVLLPLNERAVIGVEAEYVQGYPSTYNRHHYREIHHIYPFKNDAEYPITLTPDLLKNGCSFTVFLTDTEDRTCAITVTINRRVLFWDVIQYQPDPSST